MKDELTEWIETYAVSLTRLQREALRLLIFRAQKDATDQYRATVKRIKDSEA